MIADLEALGPLGAELSRRARAAGVLAIVRAQSQSVRQILVRDGKPESTSVSYGSGLGIQLVTAEGRSALASRDDLCGERALQLFRRVAQLVEQGDALGLAGGPVPELETVCGRSVPAGIEAFGAIDLAAVGRRLAELEREVRTRVPGTLTSISYRAELDAWRIFRSDGSDVLFAMPRCTLGLRANRDAGGSRHGVSAVVPSPDPALLRDAAAVERFLDRAVDAARLALALPEAPNHPSGSFPLVIDYALAKGLAHEAFGHASEADGFRSSILARDGRFRRGEDVGAAHVSIIDEPIADDHAWQPFSSNALRRRAVRIVDHGKLDEGLTDPWSAGPAKLPITGSARAESYRNAPLPRMSNIRLEVDDPLPAPGRFEDYGPGEVRDLLDQAGVFRRHREVVFLSGYSGGQVNPTSGDFVFNCKAIYVLGPSSIRLHKPAIFSGSMFGALHSVREAFGPLRLDALGYCGKWGQSVPSSGGSHYFLMLDPHPDVRLGGG